MESAHSRWLNPSACSLASLILDPGLGESERIEVTDIGVNCNFFLIPAHNGDDVWINPSAMARTPNEYIVHLLFDGGHREEVRFHTIQEFQKWYSGEFVPKSTSDEFISVPVPKINPGEYMVIRPSRLLAIRVEPVFSSSVERY